MIFSDYGYNISAPREIAINKESSSVLSEIFSRVYCTKLVLIIASAIIFTTIILFTNSYYKHYRLFLYSFSLVIGHSLNPVWLFQGLEQLKYYSAILVPFRLISAILLIFFINEPSDYLLVNLVNGTINSMAGIFCILWAIKKYNLKFHLITLMQLVQEIKTGALLVLSNLSLTVLNFGNVLILNMIVKNEYVVGQFSVAEKIIQLTKQVLVAYSQVIYPQLSSMSMYGTINLAAFFKKIHRPFLITIFFGSLLICLGAPFIVLFITGEISENTVLYLRLLSLTPLLSAINIKPSQILTVFDLKRSYFNVLFWVAVLSIPINIFFASILNGIGTSISMILNEVFVFIGFYMVIKYHHPQYFILLQPNRNYNG